MHQKKSGPVFIVGCPRSGNTLLACILCRHPEVFIFFELGVAGALYQNWVTNGEKRGSSKPEAFANHLLETWSHWIENRTSLELQRRKIIRCAEQGEHTYEGMLSRCMQMLARQVKNKVKYWGDKTPQHIGAMEEIRGLFPKARFIHIRRDPRNVVASLTTPSFTPASNDLLFNTEIVRQYWRAYKEQKRLIDPGSLYEVRYENLVRSPRSELKRLCTFLDIPYSEKLLGKADSEVREATGWPSYKGWEKIRPSLADPPELEPEVCAALENVAEEMGYGIPSADISDQMSGIVQLLPHKIAYGVLSRLYKCKYPVSNTFFMHEPVSIEHIKTWLWENN